MFKDVGSVSEVEENTAFRLEKAFTMERVEDATFMFRQELYPISVAVKRVYVSDKETKDYLKKQLPESMIIVEN